VRDEAHRFAVSFHRKKREKTAIRSALDEVKGIGPTRKKALIAHFGSVKRIREASEDQIASVPGITLSMARHIKTSL
jgi:excinuclease ABC subunit C